MRESAELRRRLQVVENAGVEEAAAAAEADAREYVPYQILGSFVNVLLLGSNRPTAALRWSSQLDERGAAWGWT